MISKVDNMEIPREFARIKSRYEIKQGESGSEQSKPARSKKTKVFAMIAEDPRLVGERSSRSSRGNRTMSTGTHLGTHDDTSEDDDTYVEPTPVLKRRRNVSDEKKDPKKKKQDDSI